MCSRQNNKQPYYTKRGVNHSKKLRTPFLKNQKKSKQKNQQEKNKKMKKSRKNYEKIKKSCL